MAFVGEPVFIKIGEVGYSYQVFYDDKGVCEAVRFYDEDGFLNEFMTVEEMKEYINHAGPEIVNEEFERIKRFRKKCDIIEALNGDYVVESGLTNEEKVKNMDAFIKRLNMLKGDMNAKRFGKVVGLAETTMYALLNGRRSPGPHMLKRIADRSGVTIDWLLGG